MKRNLCFCLITILIVFSPLHSEATEIQLEKQAGIYTLPVRINGVISLNFILDSGASEVVIPVDVVLTLVRAGTIRERDFLPGKTYTLADGSELKSPRFIIRELELGEIKINNVQASVAPPAGKLLLGQSLLERLGSWTFDNNKHVLIVGAATESSQSPKGIHFDSPKIIPSTSKSAKTIKIELLQGKIDPQTVGALSGISCRNEDHIVHLDISVDWLGGSMETESSGYERLIFWNKKEEYLFPKGSYFYLHGSYIIKGYFIARSGGMHQGIISNAFEKVDDATIMLNPNVEEIKVTSSHCH